MPIRWWPTGSGWSALQTTTGKSVRISAGLGMIDSGITAAVQPVNVFASQDGPATTATNVSIPIYYAIYLETWEILLRSQRSKAASRFSLAQHHTQQPTFCRENTHKLQQPTSPCVNYIPFAFFLHLQSQSLSYIYIYVYIYLHIIASSLHSKNSVVHYHLPRPPLITSHSKGNNCASLSNFPCFFHF